ncbi:MAG: glycosyltransferase family 1 protein [Candidatus Thermoplasmatota archaeon]|nr:glycosyltransferase family 1 protein [Candidatus Thermoplasmatota archaeon]
MKVAIFTGTYIENKDGVARSLYELVQTLREKDHEVGIWAPEITPQKDTGIYTFKMPSVPIPLYPDYKMTIYLKDVIKELRKFEPDIIQISTPDLIAFKFLKYAKIEDVPVVSIYHTDFPSYLKYYKLDLLEGTVWKEMVRFYNKCDMVFAPTEGMKELLERKGVKKVMIWSRGIHQDHFNPERRSERLRREWGAENKKVILFSGRFVKYKDLDIVVKVYKKIEKMERRDIVFTLLGSGPMTKELRRKMPDAIFPGYLHDDDLYKAYASGDIFLFPSTTETFGNVIQEAISSGLPAVVSDTGGCKEIIKNSRAGTICEGKNSDAFTEAVIELIDNNRMRSELRVTGIEWSKKRTWRYINDHLIDQYRMLIENKKRETP